MGTSEPEQRLMDFLSLTNQKNEKLPDFFVIALQEVKAQPQSMILDALFRVQYQFTTYTMRVIRIIYICRTHGHILYKKSYKIEIMLN